MKSKLKLMTIAAALLNSMSSTTAFALAEGQPGFNWACDPTTGHFVCNALGSGPTALCRWEGFLGDFGYVTRGTSIGHFCGYDCRQTMPNGPFWVGID